MKKSLLLLGARRSRQTQASRQSPGNASRQITGFVGISLQGGTAFRDRLFTLIGNLPAGTTELMTHPGHTDADLAKRDSYTVEREIELKVLCSTELRELLQDNRVALVNFGDQTAIVTREHELAQYS